jgi:hypothetical protein
MQMMWVVRLSKQYVIHKGVEPMANLTKPDLYKLRRIRKYRIILIFITNKLSIYSGRLIYKLERKTLKLRKDIDIIFDKYD